MKCEIVPHATMVRIPPISYRMVVAMVVVTVPIITQASVLRAVEKMSFDTSFFIVVLNSIMNIGSNDIPFVLFVYCHTEDGCVWLMWFTGPVTDLPVLWWWRYVKTWNFSNTSSCLVLLYGNFCCCHGHTLNCWWTSHALFTAAHRMLVFGTGTPYCKLATISFKPIHHQFILSVQGGSLCCYGSFICL